MTLILLRRAARLYVGLLVSPGELMTRPIEPQRDCPRWLGCSVNCCPLDPARDRCTRVDLPGEPRCRLGKKRRMSIAVKYPDLLPWRGLKPPELAATLRWESLTAADREAHLSRLRPFPRGRAQNACTTEPDPPLDDV